MINAYNVYEQWQKVINRPNIANENEYFCNTYSPSLFYWTRTLRLLHTTSAIRLFHTMYQISGYCLKHKISDQC